MSKATPRPDGFAGQHMVVLPEPLRSIARRHPLLRSFHVTDAGYFPAAADHLLERPRGATTSLVILCLAGEGWLRFEGKTRVVHVGDVVWLPAHKPHAYGARHDSPWTISWAHFDGDEVRGWREFLQGCAGSADPLWSLPPTSVDLVALDRVCRELERGHAIRHQISAVSALRSALSQVAEILVEHRGVRTARDRVAASIETMVRDCSRNFRLGELATAAGMSVTHYSAHFRKLTGFAPIDYLIRLRIKQACRLLDTTQSSVGEIAEVVGYQDAYYFTRCFRRVMNCSPRHYRAMPKG